MSHDDIEPSGSPTWADYARSAIAVAVFLLGVAALVYLILPAL